MNRPVTAYHWGLLVVTSDKEKGNRLAGGFGVSSRDAHTFDNAIRYDHASGPRYVVRVQVAAFHRALAECYNGAAPYVLLNNAGFADSDVADLKADVSITVFSLAQFFDGTTVDAALAWMGLTRYEAPRTE